MRTGRSMQDRTVANEFEGPQRSKSGDRIGIGKEAGLRQSGSHADHVLLGHSDIDEAVRKAAAKRLHHHVAQVAGEQNHALISGGELVKPIQ